MDPRFATLVATAAANLVVDNGADNHCITYKSDKLAIVTLEFTNDWARKFQVTPKGVVELT